MQLSLTQERRRVQGALEEALMKMRGEIAKAVPHHVDAEGIVQAALGALRSNVRLRNCTTHSFLRSVMTLAQVGLEANTELKHAFLIPRWNNRLQRHECGFVLGYHGMVTLCYRSGRLDALATGTVRAGDALHERHGTTPSLRHIIANRRGAMTHAYAVAWLKGARHPIHRCLDRAEVEKRRRQGAAPNSWAWRNEYAAMAEKTALRVLWAALPRSSELMPPIEADNVFGAVEGQW